MKTHLVFALMTVALLALVITQHRGRTLTFDTVIRIAEDLSREPYHPPQPPSPALRALNYDQARDIRYRPEATLWQRQGLPFQARFFFAAGAHNADPVTVFQVNRDGAGEVRFSPDQFDFGPLVSLTAAEKAQGHYSGFRLYHPLNRPDQLDELIVFQGASYFRPLARDLLYGLSARGIAIDTLGREDFPRFTTFWLVEPAPGATEMTLYALLEGRDVTGAYEFRLQPGTTTRIPIRAALFPRHRVKDVGLAPLTSMYWYGENTSNTFGNWRPEVHDSDGLQIQRGNGEWLWRPLSWSQQRQVNVFPDTHPKGFGLFQRDRDFTHYQDTEAHYHQRPSIWIEPTGDWGAGAVVLLQNPTRDEYADNIVASWRPDAGLTPGQRLDLAYTLHVFGDDAGTLPPLGRCVSTRIDYQNAEYYRLFVLDFTGGPLAGASDVQADIWTGKHGTISAVTTQRIPNSPLWRVTFTVSTAQTNQPIEIGCTLRDKDGKALTETWTDTWVK